MFHNHICSNKYYEDKNGPPEGRTDFVDKEMDILGHFFHRKERMLFNILFSLVKI